MILLTSSGGIPNHSPLPHFKDRRHWLNTFAAGAKAAMRELYGTMHDAIIIIIK
jgi:hypothetical protein